MRRRRRYKEKRIKRGPGVKEKRIMREGGGRVKEMRGGAQREEDNELILRMMRRGEGTLNNDDEDG